MDDPAEPSRAPGTAVSGGDEPLSPPEPPRAPAPLSPSGPPRASGRKWKAVFFALAMAGIVGGVAWALLGSKLLVVRSVVVTGTHLVPQSEVLAVAGVQPGTPLIRVDTGQVASRVETIRQVRSATVTKSWPNRLVIAVRERTPALAVATPGGGFDLVDAAGVLVRWSATRTPGLPRYLTTTAPASLRGDPDVSAAAAVLGELPATLRGMVASVTVPAPDQVTLRLADGVTVLWGGTDRAAEKGEVLRILMRTHASYYNVSAPGTAVTRSWHDLRHAGRLVDPGAVRPYCPYQSCRR